MRSATAAPASGTIRSSRGFELADNLDFNVGRKHQMRVGILLEGDEFSNFDAQNNAGTFTFSDIEAFDAGRPTSFTQRIGQVNTKFNQYQFGALLAGRHPSEQQVFGRASACATKCSRTSTTS